MLGDVLRGHDCVKREAVEVGKSLSHHYRDSVWQREAGRRCPEIQCYWRSTHPILVYRDREVWGMGWTMGSIYSGDPGVDWNYLIPSYHWTKIHPLTFPTVGLTRSFWEFIDAHKGVVTHGLVASHVRTLFLQISSWNRSFIWIPSGCGEMSSGLLVMGTLRYTSTISSPWEPKRRFWFGNLSTEQWERPPPANLGNYRE